jgi:hypothetical protein
MFNDLFHLIHSLDHNFRGEKGKRVPSCGCRGGPLSVRWSAFKAQIRRILHDIDFALGDSDENSRGSSLKRYVSINGFLVLGELAGLVASTLPCGPKQFPDYCKMMVVVFGDEIQMVHQAHRLLQTRVIYGLCK